MSAPLHKLHVLVGEPSSHMAALLAQMLHGLRIRSVQALLTADAVTAELGRRPFDVVLLDEALVRPNGFALLHFLRQTPDHPNRLVPVIMMAAAPEARTVAAARDAGVTEFLRKPFSMEHLRSRIDEVLNATRPFVDKPVYAGPDRRRRRSGETSPRRRASDILEP